MIQEAPALSGTSFETPRAAAPQDEGCQNCIVAFRPGTAAIEEFDML